VEFYIEHVIPKLVPEKEYPHVPCPLTALATSFSWNKSLPRKKFLVKDGEINRVTRVFRTG
jgi:hypothetical protein